MNTVKQLVKSRNLGFLHPDVIASADDAGIETALKSVGYFRNFSIFKILYTLLNKSRSLNLDMFKNLYEILEEYKKTHPKDYFIEGFSTALQKSNVVPREIKTLYAIMIYNQLHKSGNLFNVGRTARKMEKAVSDYYLKNRYINVALIRKSKVLKINNDNIVKSIIKWNLY